MNHLRNINFISFIFPLAYQDFKLFQFNQHLIKLTSIVFNSIQLLI